MREPIGRTLVTIGAISQGQVHAALRAQAYERVMGLRGWVDGPGPDRWLSPELLRVESSCAAVLAEVEDAIGALG